MRSGKSVKKVGLGAFLVSVIVFTSAVLGQTYQVKTVQVKGMVCAFCAQGLKKKFLEDPKVKDINIHLEKGQVELYFVGGQELSDDRIQEIVEDAGYSVGAKSKP